MSVWGEETQGQVDHLLSREPNEGLHPRTPISKPEQKSDAHQLSYPCAPLIYFRERERERGSENTQRHSHTHARVSQGKGRGKGREAHSLVSPISQPSDHDLSKNHELWGWWCLGGSVH